MKDVILQGDALTTLKTLPDECVDLVVTSPPFFNTRDYEVEGQLGQEKTPGEYVYNLMLVMNECKRVLKKQGSLWINLADSYDKNKSLNAVPERFVVFMTAMGWIRRNTIIWHKPNAMPNRLRDAFTIDFDYFYFFTKSSNNYYFEPQYKPYSQATMDSYRNRNYRKKFAPIGGVKHAKGNKNSTYSGNEFNLSDKGAIMRCVWKISTKRFKEAHFAVFPEPLIKIPIKACCPIDGIVLDPFMGAGTVGVVAKKLLRYYIGIELKQEYIDMANRRLNPLEAYVS